MSLILSFLMSLGGRALIIGGGVAALIGVYALNNSHQRKVGETRAVTKIEKANANATQAGRRAADRATDASVRGRRDPSTRDD